jgi:hypothetical protein
MYFRKKQNAGAIAQFNTFPSNWYWSFSGWNY